MHVGFLLSVAFEAIGQFSKDCLKWASVPLLIIWFQGELMGMASPQHSNYLGCFRAVRAPGKFDRVLIIWERFLMITFCTKMEEQNKAYILHISWVLANEFSLYEGPHGRANKKYLSPHRSSGLVRVNKRRHLTCGTTQILYISTFRASVSLSSSLNTQQSINLFFKQCFLCWLSTL